MLVRNTRCGRGGDQNAADEAGYCFQNNGKHFICTNANDRTERQRFTVCHEIAHIVLGLPSQHGASPWWSYEKRPLAEVLCDVFAAELLLPYDLFQPQAEKPSISLTAIDDLAERFQASMTATGSRYAAVLSAPVAFVLSERGKVRYASRSNPLKNAYAWIPPTSRFTERLLLNEGTRRRTVRQPRRD